MNDDPTKKLPDDETQYNTKPTITTVLERLNEIGDSLRAEIETLRVGQEQLRVDLTAEIQSLRSEMNQRFADVDKQFVLLNKKFRMHTEEVM
ncbi:MAG TPA: hypothetical protein VKA60_16815 [Blastocatellia bacterium]|nr:hypothetical protein [Blastocatellia bacterium]